MPNLTPVSARGIAAGAVSFIALVTVVFFTTNNLDSALGVPGVFLLWALAWIAPGYAAARFSTANNLVDSAAAGALVGITAGTALVFAIDPNTSLPVSKTVIVGGSALGAALTFFLGECCGLLFSSHG